MEVEGFRKGKAPHDIALKNVDQGKVYGEVVNEVLPEAYAQAVREHNLTPVVSPKIQIVTAEENKDWVFKATGAEKPEVELNNYKDEIKTINSKGKIWTPGEGTKEETPEEKTAKESQRVSEVIEKLLAVAKVELPDLLVEEEVSRLLSQLVDDVRKAGLTIDQYLASTGRKIEDLQDQYRLQAERALKLEFILGKIAEEEKLTVSEQELNKVMEKETDPKAKEALKNQAYLLASVLRREKTLNYLLSL